jgi:hypothetical protein
MRYAVEIDQLVLRGFGPVDRRRLRAGIRDELARLLARDGLPRDVAARERMPLQRIDLVPGDDGATGRNLARSVHAGLSR